MDDVALAYSRVQATPALSNAEAELNTVGGGTCEAILIQTMSEEMPQSPKDDVEIESDSSEESCPPRSDRALGR